jgi:hypothetical protein
MHIKILVQQLVEVFQKATAQIWTNVRAGIFNAGLLAIQWFSLVPEQMLS